MSWIVIPGNKDKRPVIKDIQLFPTEVQAKRYITLKIKGNYPRWLLIERETNFSYARR